MAPKTVDLASFVSGPEASQNVLACSFLLATTMLVAYISKKYHWIYFPESSAALVLGMFFGFLVERANPNLALTFQPEIFFYGLLPIIIFNAGYGLKKKDFFRNFATITLFAVVGTVISSLVYGLLTYLLYTKGYITHMVSESPLLESLMFGSLISAIDPVATLSIFADVEAPALLYNVVFGESLVNDASSIVLFRTFESFLDEEFEMKSILTAILRFILISIGSILLGVIISLISALVLRFMEVKTEFVKFELAMILVSAYISYSVAELLSLSGIMSLFFCGICNAHYSYYSTTHACKISSKYAFESLSFMSEMFVFAYLGMQVMVADQVFDLGLLISAIPLCLLSRAANIFPLAWLANRTRRHKIPRNMIFVMWFSGLRGAIAFALSVNMPSPNRAIETTTLFVVMFTTVLLGGSTAPLLHGLGLTSEHGDSGIEDRVDVGFLRRSTTTDPLVDDSGLQDSELPRFHESFKWIDSTYLKPLFGGQLVTDAASSAAKSSKLLEEIGEFMSYKGCGYTLQVPSSWMSLPSAFALVSFQSQRQDTMGVPEAELDVIQFTASLISADSDPATFLLTFWTDICPELSPPHNEPEEVVMERSHSQSSFRLSSGRSDYAPLPGSTSRTETDSFEQTDASRTLPRSDSTVLAPSHQGSVVPAFVMHCQYADTCENSDLFRYEVVAHPEDLGTHKASIRHYYIAIYNEGTTFYACRAKASETFIFKGGIIPVKTILDSFTLTSEACG